MAMIPSRVPGEKKAISLVNKIITKALDQVQNNGTLKQLKERIVAFQSGIIDVDFGNPTELDPSFTIKVTCKDGTCHDCYITHSEFIKLYLEICNNGLDTDMDKFNDMLRKLNDIAKSGLDIINKMQDSSLDSKVTEKVDNIIDRVWKKLDSVYGGLESRFELALFSHSAGKYGVIRTSFSTATPVGTSVTVWMTNLNAEVLVPAFKKHLCITNAWGAADKTAAINAANASINKVYDGTVKTATITGLQSGVTYEVAYSGLDYFGKQETRYFYIKCK